MNCMGRKYFWISLISIVFLAQQSWAHDYNLTLNAPSVDEGGELVYTITIDQAPYDGDGVSVDISTGNTGSADPSSDYIVAGNTTIVFDASHLSYEYRVQTNDDHTAEPDETVIVDYNVTCTDGSTTCTTNWSSNSATGTIVDNDYVIHTTLSDSTLSETSGSYSFTISIDEQPTGSETVTVNYLTLDGTAVAGSDYTSTSGQVVFTSSSPLSETITVPISNDATPEPDENFTVNVDSSGTNFVNVDSATAVLTITDNDYTISWNAADVTVSENGAAPLPNDNSVTYTLSIDRTPASGDTVTIPLTFTDGSTQGSSDYSSSVTQIVFDENSGNSQNITITIVDDTQHESDETFTVTLATGSNYTISGGDYDSAITVQDNDYTIAVSPDFSVDVDDGSADVQVILQPARKTGDTVRFDYGTNDGTATAGSDYTAVSGTLEFSDSDTGNPKHITVPLLNDGSPTGSETFTLDLSNITTGNASFSDDSCTITLNDHAFELTAGNTVTVDEDAGDLVFIVQPDRDPQGSEQISFHYETVDGTALAGSDYTAISGDRIIDATDTVTDKEIHVPILDDDVEEILEHFTLQISNPSANTNITDNTAVGNITDDDYIVDSFPDIQVDENVGNAVLTVTLDRPVVGDIVTFNVLYGAGTPPATGGSTGDWDYTGSQTTLTISSGQQSGTIAIPINDDSLVELAEKFAVTIVPASNNVTVADDTAEVTINIDEKYHFSINDVNVIEAETTVDFTISLVNPTALQTEHDGLTILFSSQDDSATSPADYEGVSGDHVTFDTSSSSRTATITVHDDTIDEGAAERFFVNLEGATLNGIPVDEIVEFDDPQGICTIQDTDYIITPTWNGDGTVTLESPVGSQVPLTNGQPVGIGNNAQARFTVSPDFGIHEVLIDGVAPGSLSYITVSSNGSDQIFTFETSTPQGAHTIDVLFDHQIEMIATGNGTVSHTTPNDVSVHDTGPREVVANHGENEDFLIQADTGNCVTDLEIDGSSVSAFVSDTANWNNNTYTFFNVTVSHRLNAVFGSATITVNLGANDHATGTSDDLYIQDSGASGSGWRAYKADSGFNYSDSDLIKEGVHGESFSLPADTPCDTRYIVIQFLEVDGWLRPSDIHLDLSNGFVDQTVEGLYDASSHVLTLVSQHGTISIDPTGTQAVGDNRWIYPANTTVELTAVADPGWFFQSWKQDASGTNQQIDITMDKDRTVEAVFVQGCQDNDNDGYTTADVLQTGCQTSQQIDCDDSDLNINPAAVEICGDGIDQDCDGQDLACGNNDIDGDHDGYTPNQGDCNDGDASVHPGAYDAPGDSVDEDCYDGPKEMGSEEVCVDASEIPASTARKPAPPMIMFLLDDSGSMDWEFMTNESSQLYKSRLYVYHYPGDARVYGDTALTNAQRLEWKSQWAKYNKIYFDPKVSYSPWPYWQDVAALATYTGSEQGTVTSGERSYDSDNTTFPDIAFVDGFVHADLDHPRYNTVDREDGHSWSYLDQGGESMRFDLNGTFASVTAGGGQQVMVTRDSQSTEDDTRADAIGLSTSILPQPNSAHRPRWYNNNLNYLPEIIYDDRDGADVYMESGAWNNSGYNRRWGGRTRWTEELDAYARWRLNLSAGQEGDYYIYVWVNSYPQSDENALYTVFYHNASGDLVTENIRLNQRPDNPARTPSDGPRWMLLTDHTFHFHEQASSVTITIPNAHYYTWNDVNGNGVLDWNDTDGDNNIDPGETVSEDIYLVTIPGSGGQKGDYSLHYYLFNDVNHNQTVEDGELIDRTANPPTAVVPLRYDEVGNQITDPDELAYVVRQNFADWFSFYRRKILTAKAAVGLTVYDMNRVELGVHTINHTYHQPLVLMMGEHSPEMISYLSTIYNINAVGGTPLRRGLYEVGKYFESGDTGDYQNLQTSEGLNQGTCSGDDSVFWDARENDDSDDCDDSGGECQRAFVIAMTDGYYDSRTYNIGNVDAETTNPIAFRDGAYHSMADLAMYFYNTDLDSGLDDRVPAKGFDTATHQHLVTYAVSFGVFGYFDPKLFPDCLPGCDTPGENGCPDLDALGVENWSFSNGQIQYADGNGPFDLVCPNWHDSVYTYTPASVDDLFHASVNSRGKFLNAANPEELVMALQAIKGLIESQTATAASVAVSSKKISQGTLLYQSIYDSGDWSGDVVAKCLDHTGTIASCQKVSCEISCRNSYDSCMNFCGVADAGCIEICKQDLTSCYENSGCDSYQTCNGQHNTCIENCAGDATCEVNCDQQKQTCLQNPPEEKWSADEMLDSKGWQNRAIITADRAGNGLPFQWANLNTQMRTALGGEENRLNYLRGDQSNEMSQGGTYRSRSSMLGDFVNSEPYHYKNDSLAIDWVFVGANDGMLHVFDAQSGEEIFAYVPHVGFEAEVSTVYSRLWALAQPGYNSIHKYFVDGYITVKDLGDRVVLVGGLGRGGKGYYALDLTAAAQHHDTIEAHAADIVLWEYTNLTVPSDPTEPLPSEHLGYSFSRPQIIRSHDPSAEWIVVVGNGYESTNGQAELVTMGLNSSGQLQWTNYINTGVGNAGPDQCNGLSTPAVLYPHGDYLYAGDLLGNLWKFDLSGIDRSFWRVYFESANGTPQPLFVAKSNAGYRQPITIQPRITSSCALGARGYMIEFGTGRLLDPEVDGRDKSVQTVYGIWDWSPEWESLGENPQRMYLGEFESVSPLAPTSACQNSCVADYGDSQTSGTCIYECLGNTECEETCARNRDMCIENCDAIRTLSNMPSILDADSSRYVALLRQTQVYAAGVNYNSDGTLKEQEYGATDLDQWDEIIRVVSDNRINWMMPGQKNDFISSSNKIVHHVGWYFDLPGNGERVVSDMAIVNHKLVFTTNTPSDSPCESGGYSNHWVVDVCTGGRTTHAFFDVNSDEIINSNDYINIGTDSHPMYVAISSIQVEGLSPSPTLVEVENGEDRLYFGDKDKDEGIRDTLVEGFGIPVQYWRELDWQ